MKAHFKLILYVVNLKKIKVNYVVQFRKKLQHINDVLKVSMLFIMKCKRKNVLSYKRNPANLNLKQE